MLTDDGLASLRMAATLSLTLPSVRVRVASPTRLLAEIGWTFEGHIGNWVRLRPCAFRVAVGRAWEQRQQGHQIDFCGLGDSQPIISMEVGQDVVPAEGCHAVLGLEGPPLQFHEDPATGVTLVHAETEDPDVDRYPHLVAHLTAIRGRLLAEELIADPLLVR